VLLKQSRAALRTIQIAVDAVADSIQHLKWLQAHAHRGHRAALVTLRLARCASKRQSASSPV
jgi:hypothetical protein